MGSLDPVLQHFVPVPSPYRLEDAASFVDQIAIAGWESGAGLSSWPRMPPPARGSVGSLLRHEVTASPAGGLP
jgi:hypothetical protein